MWASHGRRQIWIFLISTRKNIFSANEMKILRKINFFMQISLILCCCIIFLNFFLCIQPLLLLRLLKATLTSPSRHSFLFRLFLFGVFVCNDAIWRVNLNILLIWLLYEMLGDGEGWFACWLPDRLDRSLSPISLTHPLLTLSWKTMIYLQ